MGLSHFHNENFLCFAGGCMFREERFEKLLKRGFYGASQSIA
jgi:hypothetical protein